MSKWRDIKKQKPKNKDAVLITDGNIVTAAEYFSFQWSPHHLSFYSHGWDGYEWEFDFDLKAVTHWMPLPNPPVKGKK